MKGLDQAGQDICARPDNTRVRITIDRGMPNVIDGQDRIGPLHARDVLDRPGYPDSHIKSWSNALACLPDLAFAANKPVLDSPARTSEATPVARSMLGDSISGENWSALAESKLAATDAPDEWQLADRRVSIA